MKNKCMVLWSIMLLLLPCGIYAQTDIESGNNPEKTAETAYGQNQTFTVNGVPFTMVFVKGGTFTMGAPEQGGGAEKDEKPAHQVSLEDYLMGETEVTQALWKAVMGEPISKVLSKYGFSANGKGDDFPMYYVSWEDCQTFINKLNQLTGKTFRLPTEAQWEYAARGGQESKGYKYAGNNVANNVSWNANNSGDENHPVKGKEPNELGLYDMSGNVWEWCSDWYGDYGSEAQTNPSGPSTGAYRIYRGGASNCIVRYCRISFRNRDNSMFRSSDLGFRLVLLVR